MTSPRLNLHKNFLVVCLTAIFLGAPSGCDSTVGPKRKATVKAHGKLMIDGKPGKGMVVTFHPVDAEPATGSEKESSARPSGRVDDDGNYVLTTYEKDDGAPPGDYIVTVAPAPARKLGAGKPDPRDPKTNTKYAKPATSGIKRTVGTEPENEIKVIEI